MKQNTNEKKGRRPLYETPEQLQAAVDEYFRKCEGVPVDDKNGVPVTKRNGRQLRAEEVPPTLTGLALCCGYKNRETFTRQKNRSAAFNDVVLVARLRIADYYERALMDSDTFDGAAFMLSMAFGWRKRKAEEQEPPKVVILNRTADQKKAAQESQDGSTMAHDLRIDLMN
jgi:hypothetical protein